MSLNFYYNSTVVETSGIRQIAGGGTGVTTLSSLLQTVNQVPINIQAGTTYTILSNTDLGGTIASTSNTGLTATLVGSYPVGFQTSLLQLSTGRIAVSGQNITINQANNYFKTTKQYSVATLLYVGSTGGWVLFGDISA